MTTLTHSRQEIEAQIVEKASTDPAFRQRLLDDPKAAIADVLGVTLPPGMTITVVEEEPGRHILALPPALPSVDALPLDDLELALVGGGRTLRPATTYPNDSLNRMGRVSAFNARSANRGSC